MRRFIVAAVCLASVSLLAAQEPPVRRAVPVAPLDAPAFSEPEVRRAIPVAPPRAPEPEAVEAARPAPTPLPAEPGEEIRAAPALAGLDPASAAIEQANAFYARKMYDLAVAKYGEFLTLRPVGAERQAALFRMGESLRALERKAEAATAYKRVLSEFNAGDFVGPAAYRLGEAQYTAGNLSEAADSFARAAQNVRDPKLRLAAKFFEARSLDGSGRRIEALSAYREIAAQTQDNPYRERALFDLAEADAQGGLTDSAFRQFRKLAETAQSASVRTGAAVKAGLLAIDAKDFGAARPLLEQAAASNDMAAWSSAAKAGLVRLEYEAENYEAAARLAANVLPQLPAESKPDVLLLAANAQRQLGRQAEALALYDQLASEYASSPAAREAGFHRLVSLVAQKDERALDQIDKFLASANNAQEKAKAALLKAELLFGQNRFAEAAPLYEKAIAAEGTEKYRGDALYKLAWCQFQEKKYDQATSTLTRFLTQFPRHPQASTALAQRARAELETGQREEALADFSEIISRHSGAPEREDAMLQQALLLGNMQRPAEMAAAFQRLLAEYPESKSAAQANFWIGYAAFDAKKYRDAIPPLEAARKLDPGNYGERASLRLLLSHYYLEDHENAAREAVTLGPDKAPVEVREWLGRSAISSGDYSRAVQFLRPLAEAPDASDELRVSLAQAQVKAGDYEGARATLNKLLPRLHEPKAKASAHLLMAEALLGQQMGAEAKTHAEEALKLQPEGRLNAEARLVNARALLAQGRDEDAARAFMAVALLYDEQDLSPQALLMAEQAYQKAGNAIDAGRAREERQRRYPDFKEPEAGQP